VQDQDYGEWIKTSQPSSLSQLLSSHQRCGLALSW